VHGFRVNRRRLEVLEVVVEAYGRLTLAPGGDPLDELIGTILSQNTSDVNSGRAYAQLRSMYPSWEEVLDTSDDELYEAIKPAGLGRIKAPRIKNTLREVLRRRGELNLDFLEQLPLAESKRWLTSLDGIGPKTAACVLLFALGRPALPVDTHVHRVSQRLGLIGPKVSADAAHALLEAETLDERHDREDAERAREAAARLEKLVKNSPCAVWFPDDGTGAQWVPSFFTMGRDRGRE
jgi:endonuclease-3